jgi:methylamine dehydrogenase light chain
LTTLLVDKLGERAIRNLARRTSRRSLLSRIGAVLAGSAAIPLLPVARPAEAAPLTTFARNAHSKDVKDCNYWRYCAIDGSLCTCCGGGVHTCPPGSTAAPTSWIGTCLNPDDGKSYLIAYRDCCGKEQCGRCQCNNNDGETPLYRSQTNNDIIWCFGAPQMIYHCSTAVLIGMDQ